MSLPLAETLYWSTADQGLRRALRQAQQFECSKIVDVAEYIRDAHAESCINSGLDVPYPEQSRLPAPLVWLEFDYTYLAGETAKRGLLLHQNDVGIVGVYEVVRPKELAQIVAFSVGAYRPGIHTTEIPNPTDQWASDERIKICRLAAQMVACITHPKLCDQTARSESRQVQRQKARSDGFSVEWRDVSIRNTVHGKAGDSEAATRPLHFVLGHFKSAQPHHPKARNINGRWLTWIEGYWRGNPAVGIRLHRYHPASPPTTEASAAGP